MNLGEAIKKINKIDKISSKPVKLRDVYIFLVTLADNDIDDDRDVISDNALQELAEKCIGKTGYVGNRFGARIFDTEISNSHIKNKLGNNKQFLKAYCWIKKTPENKELIQAIRNSITRKASLSFSIRDKICSECGGDILKNHCGCKYGYQIINNINEVYEWEFEPVVKGED